MPIFFFNEKEFLMKPSPKPEWLELSANDNATFHRRASRGLPVLALVATAAIIGAGAVFAQPQVLPVANADTNVITTSQTAQLDSTVATPTINIPTVGTVPAEDEDFEDLYDEDLDIELNIDIDDDEGGNIDDDEGDDD